MDLNIKLSNKELRIMKHRGVAVHEVIGQKNTFNIMNAIERIKPTDLYCDVKLKTYGTKKQLAVLDRLVANPFRQAPIICISSIPTDHRAKVVAAHIMYSAIKQHSVVRKVRHLDLPLWHKVYGGFQDPLRDKKIAKPSMIVLTNINSDSTSVKLEKTRDILEMYDDITRIVVISGEDPITFFVNRLKHPVKAGIFLGQVKPDLIDILDV